MQITELNNISAIACGNAHCIALKNDGTVWAWGQNGYGQLGNGESGYDTVGNQLYETTPTALPLHHWQRQLPRLHQRQVHIQPNQ